jgi:hypothetical protein
LIALKACSSQQNTEKRTRIKVASKAFAPRVRPETADYTNRLINTVAVFSDASRFVHHQFKNLNSSIKHL